MLFLFHSPASKASQVLLILSPEYVPNPSNKKGKTEDILAWRIPDAEGADTMLEILELSESIHIKILRSCSHPNKMLVSGTHFPTNSISSSSVDLLKRKF